jgi:probable rRNA maturation factor
MSIHYFAEDVKFPKLQKRETSGWIKGTIISEGKSVGDISFIFCSDDYLLEVNKKYLEHDYYTDVITFDYVDKGKISGDIFISVDRIKENAKQFSTTFDNELNRILVHGVLHLLGFKDKSVKGKKIMTEKEDLYLNILNDSRLI